MTKGTKTLQIVFFDLWDTLIWEDPRTPFYAEVAHRLGVDTSTFKNAYGALGEAAMIGKIPTLSMRIYVACQNMNVKIRPDRVKSIVQECIPLRLDAISLYPDTIQTLSSLQSKGYRLGIISNAFAWSEVVLDTMELRRYFDSVVLSYTCGTVKPMPQIYIHALREIGERPEGCFFVGDGRDSELDGAKQVGFTTILVDHCHRSLRADFKVDTLADAVQIITGNRV